MGSLKVIDPGLFSTIQDEGRFGYRHFGVPVSGVMDEYAYKLANRLVGNSKSAPVIECTLRGGKYQFESEAVFALTGADMNAQLNNEAISLYNKINAKKGDVLDLGYAKRGCRAYFAIQGNWQIGEIMDSVSTFVTGKFGGFKGRGLKRGDVIEWVEITQKRKPYIVQREEIPYYSSKITINLNPGPEFDFLNESSISTLETQPFEVDSTSNRMGIRLKSDQGIKCEKYEITSSGVFPGIVQLPPSGNPIILMKDAQTVGGYPRIGVIEEPDLSRLAQLKPGAKLRFKIKI